MSWMLEKAFQQIELFSSQPDFPTVDQDFVAGCVHAECLIDITRPF
jgi:hypothetical protein